MQRNEMISEAESRMNSLGLNREVIRHFVETDQILFSDEIHIKGNPMPYPMTGEPIKGSVKGQMVENAINYLHKVDKDALPYHAVIHSMRIGFNRFEICNILYVSSNRQDWPAERVRQQTISKNISSILCLAYNNTCPEYSDFGTCTFLNINGGLIRRY